MGSCARATEGATGAARRAAATAAAGMERWVRICERYERRFAGAIRCPLPIFTVRASSNRIMRVSIEFCVV